MHQIKEINVLAHHIVNSVFEFHHSSFIPLEFSTFLFCLFLLVSTGIPEYQSYFDVFKLYTTESYGTQVLD